MQTGDNSMDIESTLTSADVNLPRIGAVNFFDQELSVIINKFVYPLIGKSVDKEVAEGKCLLSAQEIKQYKSLIPQYRIVVNCTSGDRCLMTMLVSNHKDKLQRIADHLQKFIDEKYEYFEDTSIFKRLGAVGYECWFPMNQNNSKSVQVTSILEEGSLFYEITEYDKDHKEILEDIGGENREELLHYLRNYCGENPQVTSVKVTVSEYTGEHHGFFSISPYQYYWVITGEELPQEFDQFKIDENDVNQIIRSCESFVDALDKHIVKKMPLNHGIKHKNVSNDDMVVLKHLKLSTI